MLEQTNEPTRRDVLVKALFAAPAVSSFHLAQLSVAASGCGYQEGEGYYEEGGEEEYYDEEEY